jgi:predicted Fe-Mo cluster-binding NifX family protein
MKVVIPTEDETGRTISGHFGRAPYFAWFQVEDGEIKESGVVPNTSDHFGGTGSPPEKVKALGADALITLGMGMKAINLFQGYGVAVLKATSASSTDNIAELSGGRLQELTEGCLHDH